MLEINHSIAQEEYVEWKYRGLKNFVAAPPKMRRGNAGRIAYRFTTRSLPIFTDIYMGFYKERRKIIPVMTKLYPLSLAGWFMDDGCKSYNAVYLNTQQFNIHDQNGLIAVLIEQHGIKAALNKDKAYYRLRRAVNSIGLFFKIIEPYLLSIFWYKFPKTP